MVAVCWAVYNALEQPAPQAEASAGAEPAIRLP